ncbi:MAG: LPS export ABC transporter periplasmic protein LptC [bacterium]
MKRSWLLFLAAVLCTVPSCRRAPAPAAGDVAVRAAAPLAKDKPSLLFQGFSARASHDGVVVWEAHAARARVNHDGLKAHAEVVTVVYFRRGKVVSRARADRADIGLKDYDIAANGSVEVRSSDGVILRTTHLDWDNHAQRISSSAPVTVLRGRTKLTGVGFVADRDLRDVRILSNVKAEALSVRDLREDSKTWPRQ